MMPAENTISAIATELSDLIETFVADRFTIMDDAVLDSLYADLPDIAYLRGMVKGLRRNLARQIPEIDLEHAYPKINAGSMAEALEQAKALDVEACYPAVESIGNRTLTADQVLTILGVNNPDKSPEQPVSENSKPPMSMAEMMVLSSGIDFSRPQIHEKTGENEDWEDDSIQPAHLLDQDPTATHRVPTTREFLEPHLSRLVKSETQANTNKAPQIDRNFRSNLSRYGIAQATLADITSNARPGGMFSPDTLKHSKNKDLLLVRSPVTRPREHLQLLESTDPQYYQYMWMAFEEALTIILADDSLPNNLARRLDDELLIERFATATASAAQVLSAIGNRDLLHVENVNTCIRLLTDNFPGVKLYTGDRVMVDGVWDKTWNHTILKTPKGRFVFGDEGENIVWQTPAN